jgi:hypothetical protein
LPSQKVAEFGAKNSSYSLPSRNAMPEACPQVSHRLNEYSSRSGQEEKDYFSRRQTQVLIFSKNDLQGDAKEKR